MPDKLHVRWLAAIGVLTGGCLVAPGCHTSPLTAVCAPEGPTVRMAAPDPTPEPRPDARSVRLEPGVLLKCTVRSTKGDVPPVTYQTVVRADGKVDLSAYGFVSVGGLTPKQASDAIAAHLNRYLPGARVHLAAYFRPGTGPAARTEPPAGAIARAGFQEPPLLGSAAEQKNGDKEKDKDKDAAGDQKAAAENKEKDKGDQQGRTDAAAAASLAPPVPVGGPPGHAPNELHKISLPAYVVEPPDILLVEYLGKEPTFYYDQAIRGQHLIRPDGTISLGVYGSVYVAGLTLEQVKLAIFAKLKETVKEPHLDALSVDVLAYNSKVYYVITDGGGYGEQIYRFPVTGSETVLDALAQIGGLPPVASKKHVWVARRTPDGGPPLILPVDYVGTTQGGLAGTNYQVMPGDRVYVQSECIVRLDTRIARFLSPIERVLGATLLGSETVNSIKNGGMGAGVR